MGAPVVINTPEPSNPLTLAMKAVTQYLGDSAKYKERNQQEDYARSRDTKTDERQASLDAQNAAETQYKHGRDTVSDTQSDRQFKLDSRRADTQDASAKQEMKIKQSAAEYDSKMRPILMERAIIENKRARGELITQQDEHKLAQGRLVEISINNHLKQKYGEQESLLGIEQVRASINSTYANTASTVESTRENKSFAPLREAGQMINNAQGTYNLLNPTAPGSGRGAKGADDSAYDLSINKSLKAHFDRQQKIYQEQQKAYDAAGGSDARDENGKSLTPPRPPRDPAELQADFDSNLETIRNDPSKLKEMLKNAPSHWKKDGVDNATQATLTNLLKKAAAESLAQKKIQSNMGRGGSAGSSPFNSLLLNAAQTYGIPPQIAMNQMRQESGGNNSATSPVGAAGLMQLMPDTARELGVTDVRDPVQNVNAGMKYLRQQFDRFGSWPLALAAYNAGPGAVIKYRGIPPYAETRDYVKRIWGSLG